MGCGASTMQLRRLSAADGLSENSVRDICQDSAGYIWFSTLHGLNRYDGYDFRYFTPEEADSLFAPKNTAVDTALAVVAENAGAKGSRFFTDNRGNGWRGDLKGGLVRIDRESKAITHFDVMSERQLWQVGYERYKVYESSDGTIWIATYGNGLLQFTADGRIIARYGQGDGCEYKLDTDYILAVTGSGKGDIWIGTEQAGAVQIRYPAIECDYIYPAGKENHDRANSFKMVSTADKGNIVAANRHGELFVLDGALHTFSRQKYNKNVMSAMNFGGRLWLRLRGDGLVADGISGLPGRGYDIFDMTADSKGRVWLALFGKGLGVLVPSGESFIFRRISIEDKCEWRDITIDSNGRIWGATNQGLKFFSPDSLLSEDVSALHIIDTSSGLPGNEVRQVLAAHDGRIWAAVHGAGVVALGDSLEVFTDTDGLPNKLVQSIVEDKNGNIWVGTENGLSRIGADGLIDTYFPGKNLGNHNFLESSAALLEDGRLLFGTDYGLAVVNPESAAHRTTTEKLLVSDFSTDEEGRLDATLTTLDFGPTQYSHFLEGYDKEWSKPTTDNMISYSNLPPGHYRLLAKARDQGAAWSREFVLKEFSVPSGVSWFWWTLAVIVIGARVFVVVRRRKKTESQEPAAESSTDDFSDKLARIVEHSLDDCDYSIDNFASDFGMSRTSLYNTMKQRTGMAPMEYLRKCRLERAASLLAEGSLNVSEVAAKVGMRDPLYFSRAFKARYGMAPTAYIKSHRP